MLAFVYAPGVGIPFMVVAFAFQRGIYVFGFAPRCARLITRTGGVLLITVGMPEVTGTRHAPISWFRCTAHGYTMPL